MGITDFVATVIIPVYCLWRTERSQKELVEHITACSENIVSDCEEFIRKCLQRQDTTGLRDIKQDFSQNGNAALALQVDSIITEVANHSVESMIILNSYLESEKFYQEVLKNLPSA